MWGSTEVHDQISVVQYLQATPSSDWNITISHAIFMEMILNLSPHDYILQQYYNRQHCDPSSPSHCMILPVMQINYWAALRKIIIRCVCHRALFLLFCASGLCPPVVKTR